MIISMPGVKTMQVRRENKHFHSFFTFVDILFSLSLIDSGRNETDFRAVSVI